MFTVFADELLFTAPMYQVQLLVQGIYIHKHACELVYMYVSHNASVIATLVHCQFNSSES